MKFNKNLLWIILPVLFTACTATTANTPSEAEAAKLSEVQEIIDYKGSVVTYYGNTEVTKDQLLRESKLIDVADRRFESKWKKKDHVGISNEYTIDGVFMKPGVKPRIGKPAISDEFAESVKGVEWVEFFQDELEFYGDLTVAFQRCHMKGHLAGSDDIFEGSYVILWKKVDGEWLIHYDMFNADA